eukprot:4349618-Amphidinium_carterae.1
MLHTRLQLLDPYIVPFQYGVRTGRSTSNAVYIARRVQDLAGSTLYMLALDFAKAFDSLPHSTL